MVHLKMRFFSSQCPYCKEVEEERKYEYTADGDNASTLIYVDNDS